MTKFIFRQFNPSYSDYHSRQNSAASAGRDSRVSQTGTNHSIHSNLSEQSSLSQGKFSQMIMTHKLCVIPCESHL